MRTFLLLLVAFGFLGYWMWMSLLMVLKPERWFESKYTVKGLWSRLDMSHPKDRRMIERMGIIFAFAGAYMLVNVVVIAWRWVFGTS